MPFRLHHHNDIWPFISSIQKIYQRFKNKKCNVWKTKEITWFFNLNNQLMKYDYAITFRPRLSAPRKCLLNHILSVALIDCRVLRSSDWQVVSDNLSLNILYLFKGDVGISHFRSNMATINLEKSFGGVNPVRPADFWQAAARSTGLVWM